MTPDDTDIAMDDMDVRDAIRMQAMHKREQRWQAAAEVVKIFSIACCGLIFLLFVIHRIL